jgi:outer membrane lipoprotein carrier protein
LNEGFPELKSCLAFWLPAAAAVAMIAVCSAAQDSRQQDSRQPDSHQEDGQQQKAGRLDVRQLARAVDDHYNHLRSLEADFTEIYRGEGAEREESGTLLLKKPRKMRWEYRSPRVKLFISDGQSVWFYLPSERQLRKTGLRQLDDVRSPIAFLLGKTRLENELQGLSQAVDQSLVNPEDIVLRGVPRAMSGQVNEVQLEITPVHQIARIVLMDPGGGSTEFRFSGWKENMNLADSQFHFVPPAGVETLEGAFAP